MAGFLAVTVPPLRGEVAAPGSASNLPGLSYTNHRVSAGPWSIHVVTVDRADRSFELQSAHAGGRAIGLTPLVAQVAQLAKAGESGTRPGTPVAAINGDFYMRARAYVGDPRGLQVVDGEAISAPSGGVAFWVDAAGEPHATNVVSTFRLTWPDGSEYSFGLNGERELDRAELYTPAVGPSTLATGGIEYVLERSREGPWLPLRLGETYVARVREVRETGDTGLTPDTMVLSVPPRLARKQARLAVGAEVRLVTGSTPALAGVKTAIGGGPVLVRGGRRQRLEPPSDEAYEYTSMLERHPRSAVGWNAKQLFLVQVDGRQPQLSVGMRLEEFAAYLVKLGCAEAMNLDGGGSATLWFDGRVRNSPCDGPERPVANSLIVVQRPPRSGVGSGAHPSGDAP